jgi:DNA processing protein
MACPECQRRSALIAALVPAISRLRFNREGLLGMLGLSNAQLLSAARAKVKNPGGLLRRLELPFPTERVPTALCRHDRDYPEALAQLDSAPAVLYATCTTERLRELLAAPTVAILGSRTPTDYARQIAFSLSCSLTASGVTVVSGMNTGLEGTVHEGGLDVRGNTIAVMPAGPEFHYPSQHEILHRGILAHGAAVSEFPPGFFPPHGWCFIASQRIIAALASLIVVAEAGGGSCALFTTEIAADLGADIAVVPGRVTDPGGRSICTLLRDGAHPISCAGDVLEAIHDESYIPAVAA